MTPLQMPSNAVRKNISSLRLCLSQRTFGRSERRALNVCPGKDTVYHRAKEQHYLSFETDVPLGVEQVGQANSVAIDRSDLCNLKIKLAFKGKAGSRIGRRIIARSLAFTALNAANLTSIEPIVGWLPCASKGAGCIQITNVRETSKSEFGHREIVNRTNISQHSRTHVRRADSAFWGLVA